MSLLVWNPPTPRNQPKVIAGDKVRTRVLRIDTDFFKAIASFQKRYGVWSCVAADTVVSWMKGRSMSYIKLSLLKMNAQFRWLTDPEELSEVGPLISPIESSVPNHNSDPVPTIVVRQETSEASEPSGLTDLKGPTTLGQREPAPDLATSMPHTSTTRITPIDTRALTRT